MSSRYGKIRTAEDLDLAIMNLKTEQKATGKGIRKDFNYLLDSLSPTNLVRKIVPADTLTDAGLGIVRGLKKLFADKTKQTDTEPCEE